MRLTPITVVSMTATDDQVTARPLGPGAKLHSKVRDLVWAHPVAAVFGVALFVRVAVAVVIRVHYGGALFGDDYGYHVLASQAADGDSTHWDDFTHFLYRENGGLLVPMTGLYKVFGSEVLLGQVLVALAGAATAAFSVVLVQGFAGRWTALASGLAVAALPSQALWSSLTLKDALVWFCLAALGVIVARWNRSHAPLALALCAIGMAASLGYLSTLRDHTMVVAAWASLLAVAVAGGRRWAARLALAIVVAVGVPWLAGTGPAGATLVRDNAGGVAEQRTLGAEDAATALVHPSAAPSNSPSPSSPTPTPSPTRTGSNTPGSIQDSFGGATRTAGTFRENLEYLPHGLAAMVLEPYPWQPVNNGRVRLAKVDDLLWYPMLALAVLGLASVIRYRRVLAYPLFAAAGSATMWALVEGNFGTAFRHRGEFVWAVAVLAGAGVTTLSRFRERAAGDAPQSRSPH